MAMQRLNLSVGELVATGVALIAASVSPLAFDWSAGSAMSLHRLGEVAILPALGVWILVVAVAAGVGWRRLMTAGLLAVLAGVLATAALEFVRIVGFRLFDTMPGSMPMLMGVQLTDRFMQGPSIGSNLIGWGDHVWNGIGFAFIYIALFGRMRWWVGTAYALVIATIFMTGPVMTMMGAGVFGQDFAPIKFPFTVYLAHIAFGSVVGYVVQQSAHVPNHLLRDAFGIRLGPIEKILVFERDVNVARSHHE